MIAGRRVRKRTLIPASVMNAIIARNLSTVNGVIHRQQDQKYKKPDEKASLAKKTASEPYLSPLSQYSESTEQWSSYLQQLFTLHLAGILTDEEFSAARNRLIGS